VNNLVIINRIWVGALIAIIGVGIPGCFPADEGAATASMSIPLTNMGVSSSAIDQWLAWRSQEIKVATFDLGAAGSDFYLGLHVENADTLLGESVYHNLDTNTIVVTVWVQKCTHCTFEVTIFTVDTINASFLPTRVVTTYSGVSEPIDILPNRAPAVSIDIKSIPVGKISCKPRVDSTVGYELSAVDYKEGVRFPSALRATGFLDSSVVLSNIPYGRVMNMQVRKPGAASYVTATDNGQELNILLSSPDSISYCEFDMP
jgi:hypothetical protein